MRLISALPRYLASLLRYSGISSREELRSSPEGSRRGEGHYLPELFLAREEAAAAEEVAAAAPMPVVVIRPLVGALGCRGGGDPFVGVELSDERPESSRPSSAPPPVPFARTAGTRTRVGRPVVRRGRAPFEFSVDEEAILVPFNRTVGHPPTIGSSAETSLSSRTRRTWQPAGQLRPRERDNVNRG